jgi:hypothetical protein
MKTKLLTNIKEVKDAALDTVGLKSTKEATSDWLYQILYAEHSPIRNIIIKSTWEKIKYWVSVHLTRHKIGIEHFVKTQRSDRTGVDRDNLPQGAEVQHSIVANAQAIINISRKRMCKQASKETRLAWQEFLKSFYYELPELNFVCVPECMYRGFCPEIKCCGYVNSNDYKELRQEYIDKCKELQCKQDHL